MFGFDSRRPTSLAAIDQYIGSFATPEAAEADTRWNAPQGMDFLQRQYQGITGDAFADPFEDATKARANAMTEAAMSGASVAVGSNTGMKLLSMPTAPVPPSANANVPAVATPMNSIGAPLSSWANREVVNESLRGMLASKAGAFKMGATEMQIPDPRDGNFLDVLEKRASLVGANEEFRRIQRENPDALRPISNNDPRFARDPAGKVISEGEMHPLAFDDTFREMLRQKPQKAIALYHAITNRDYKTDEDAKTKSIVEQRDARKKVIEHIKGLEADPITGELFKTVEINEYGTIKQQRVPLTPLDKAAIEKEGGVKRLYGIDLPGFGGLKKLPGATPEEDTAYRARTQQLMKEKGVSVAEASTLAHRELYQQQQERLKSKPPQQSGLRKTLNAIVDTQVAAVNAIPKFYNWAATQGATTSGPSAPLPLIPHSAEMEELMGGDVSIQDILTQGIKHWEPKLAGPFAR